MNAASLFILAIGLSMDAFSVAICKGLATRSLNLKKMCITGAWFGGFQALMPVIGFLLGSTFGSYIEAFDHWIAFVLLGLIGLNMIRESRDKEIEACDASFSFRPMLVMAIATSIDALAVGVSFAFLHVNILLAATFIGVITFVLSAIGVRIGNIFGARFKSTAELVGGVILILIGAEILLEHLGVL